MKIRTDFVTNSSSSSFITIIFNDGQKEIKTEFEPDGDMRYPDGGFFIDGDLKKIYKPEISGNEFLEKIDELYDNVWTEIFGHDLASENVSTVARLGDLKSISITEEVGGDMALPFNSKRKYMTYSPKTGDYSTRTTVMIYDPETDDEIEKDEADIDPDELMEMYMDM